MFGYNLGCRVESLEGLGDILGHWSMILGVQFCNYRKKVGGYLEV